MSGSTIGGVVGGIAGFFIGGPAGAQIGFTIGSLVGGYVDPEQIIGPRLTDARTQTSQVGIPIPFGYGTFATAGNVIWAATYDGKPLREVRREESAKGGPEQVTFSYYRSYAIGICQGPIAGILQIKRNGKVVYDARTDAEIELQLSGTPAEQLGQIIASVRANNAKFISRCTIYLGDETQVADSLIESFEGVGNVSPNRGLAYVVIEEDDLTQLQGAIPQYEFVVSMAGTATATECVDLSTVFAAWDQDGDGGLLRSSTGAAWSPADIDETGLGTSATFVDSYGGVLFALNSAGAGRYTTDIGETWGAVTGLPAKTPKSMISTGVETLLFVQDGTLLYSYAGAGVFNSRSFVAASRSWYGSAFLGGTVVVGTTQGFVNVSQDGGTTWALVSVVPASTASINKIATSDSAFVATINAGGAVYRSEDGLTWDSIATGLGFDVEGITFGAGIFVATADTGQTAYSTDDGLTWIAGETITPNSSTRDNHLIYHEGRFIVGANGGQIWTCTTPADWTKVMDNTAGAIESISPFRGTSSLVAIPDAPGYYLQADGTVVTGCTGGTLALEQIVLATIQADLFQRCGLTADDYDVSQLTDLVDGYGPLATEAGADSFTLPLMQAYFYDVAEWDGKLRAIKRGGAVTYSLGPDDLAERDGDAIEQRRVQEAELLRKVTVAYRDPAAGYGITTQDWERRATTVEAKAEKTVEVNIVTDADTAKRIAAKRGKVAWSETEEFKFSLPYGVGAKVTPTDVVSLTDKAGKVNRVRVMGVEEDSGVVEVEAIKDVQAAYTSTATGIAPTPPSITTPGLIGPTTLEVMNLPVLRDQDDELGVYVAVRGVLSGWRGAQVQISIDGGASVYTTLEKPDPSVIGYTTTELGAWASGEYPAEQSVTVYLPEAPESVSYERLLQYANRAVIGDEVIQYQTVVANGDNSYTLSGLVRGRYATDPIVHASGERFVLIDSSVTFLQAQTFMLGQSLSVRAVSYGTSADAYAWETFEFAPGTSQTEWPVHSVEAERDAGTNDAAVSWVGRGRLGGETAARHSKYFAGYRVSWDDGSTVTTADTTASTYTIPAAADPIDVTVTPLNTITGEGPASEAITV